MSHLKNTEKMEKVFVHPDCPFSAETFSLLAEFYENPSSDFHITHQKDFLRYVEKPVKYILSQVEEQLPDFIKKYINIKRERFCSIIETRKWESTAYSVAFFCEDVPFPDNTQLILRFKNQKLTFGLEVKESVFQLMLYIYKKKYRDDFDYIEIIKGYNLSNKHYFSLKSSWEEEGFLDLEEIYYEIEAEKNLYELLENILIQIPVHLQESKNFESVLFGNIFAGISFESKQILGYSSKNIINKIAQAFTKLFSFFLIGSYYYRHDLPALLDEYLSVYEKEFNPVYQLETISEITGFKTTELTKWIQAINRKGQTIIQGPPGTGKTFIAEKLAKHLIGGGDGFSDIIQFHPAYTYEDFIEGLRPTTQNGQLTYSIIPGRFLEFCEKAEACEDTCVLIIDEINRANLSQVFGELMYLLDDREDTKRFITLASGQLFRIPTNVRIIGTMNTADRSIALVDNALRRRFAFIPVYPNYEVLRQYHHREKTNFPVDKLTSILENVNRAINNKHYELGISFFLTKTLAEDIQDIWQMEIEPYLEEYFFDNQAKMDEFLWDKIKDEFSKR
ncbi:McrB family protein [Microcoleus sp. OTE_8_concoct_300]|uniref:McrB family protein n=1 Tax=Microcoleus sp. OTE_8_concoct_300 TaxID=2964710 RepID=UPI00403EF92C